MYFAAMPNGSLRLDRPDGLEDASWQAVEQALQRLNNAITAADLPLVVGSAKELTESTAKVVLAARGQIPASNIEYDPLISAAHAALDRQPGKGLAADEPVRLAAQQAAKVVRNLRELRNDYGTGHGRAFAPEVAEEVALVSVDLTMVWCRWALRRLRHAIYGRPQNLITDLSGGGRFTRGVLAERLVAANLSAVEPADQAALAVAVAHRAMSGTFLVQEEGVEACAQSGDLTMWPEPYRCALIEALILNQAGQIETRPWAVAQIGLLVAVLPPEVAADVLMTVAEKCRSATLSAWMSIPPHADEAHTAMYAENRRIPFPASLHWHQIADRIMPPPF